MLKLNSLTDSQILNLKVKQLDLRFSHEQKAVIKVFYSRLKEKNIKWRPHLWPSDEWFSPDGVGGIAVPFMLLHPRLTALEKSYLGECEGDSKKEFFKLLCHEAGHAIDNAYRLRLKKKRQQLFGLSSKKYPSSYKPNMLSKDYVFFLKDHYAQAHPDEDWAETFAVWLSTENWQRKYKGTKALEKLLYIDSAIKELSNKEPLNNNRRTYMHYKNDSRTIGDYLREKQKSLRKGKGNFFENKLHPVFEKNLHKTTATQYLRKNKFKIILDLQSKTKEDIWNLDRSFEEIKEACKSKKYSLKYNEKETEQKIKKLIIKNLQQYKKAGRTRIYM